mmetsp:Transcript_12/g.26  ORF Transcript_12/g.26 Transcript_12/m.26 type:complete len:132 (+) Transcript_12:3-398(+)
MAMTPGPDGFAFLSTSFGFEVRNGRELIDFAVTDSVNLGSLLGTTKDAIVPSVPDLTQLQESLDTVVFGKIPSDHSDGQPSEFARLFELGQLSCELVLAEQEELMQRINKAERQATRSKKRIAAYRDRAET